MNMNTVQAIIHDDILTNSRLMKFEDYEESCDEKFFYNSTDYNFCEENKLCTVQELKDYIEQMNAYAEEGEFYDEDGELIGDGGYEALYNYLKENNREKIIGKDYYTNVLGDYNKHLDVEIFIIKFKDEYVVMETTELAQFTADGSTFKNLTDAEKEFNKLKEKWDKEYAEKV